MAQAGLTLGSIRAALLAAAVLIAVDGCAQPTTTAVGGPPVHVVAGSLLLPEAGQARPPLRDTCGAAALAGLIGKARSQIPVPVDLSRRRVACTACPVAPDIRLDRVNILFDAATGLVTKVTCG